MTSTRMTSLQRAAILLVAAVAVLLFLALRSTLTAPTGEGVPGSRPACEHSQSTAQTVGRESWCTW
jgi:hypothetical protein